ncbi:MAG: hypothetical protein WCG45_05260, partial [bacterium]
MKTQKGFAPILIAIIAGIVLLAGGGTYYYSKQNKSPDFTNLMKGLSAKTPKLEGDTKQENPPVVKSDSSSLVSTEWKTYTNTKYGYQIEYPSNWIYDVNLLSENNFGAGDVVFCPPELQDANGINGLTSQEPGCRVGKTNGGSINPEAPIAIFQYTEKDGGWDKCNLGEGFE